ncbi:ABC transporter ATP-binding protein, partial [Mycobacterium tuberculosis]|nr:ABC transporter ATP-binding protein [Mycobacterium tuberculosis]
ALDGVTLAQGTGQGPGTVGETGCGKSITAKSVLGLVPSPPARVIGGDVRFEGRSVLGLTPAEMRRLRVNGIAMSFQDRMTYLNPLFTVGQQMASVIAAHAANGGGPRLGRWERRARAVDLFRRVHLPNPETLVDRYPHQLSGGQRQRVLIAMALSGKPKLLIADEPTTALDVTIQAQILDLIDELRRDLGLAVLMISHDLGVISRVCDRVAVMYAGTVVEVAPVADLFDAPRHPYTRGLLASVPHPRRPPVPLAGIAGTVPNLLHPPSGCRFRTRCDLATERCAAEKPAVRGRDAHAAACHFAPDAEEADHAA